MLGMAGMAGLTFANSPPPVVGRAKTRVVVIGGGPGGASVAKYLSQASSDFEITLVTGGRENISCYHSNFYLGGMLDYRNLQHDYGQLKARHGIKVVPVIAKRIDVDRGLVRLQSGEKLPYDRLVVAPGIDFRWDALEGYDSKTAEIMPHAWQGGPQLKILRKQLQAMPDGGLFLLSVPIEPYRCPPAPYERASLVANYFTKHKPKSKILVLDAKSGFPRQSVFMEAWTRRYGTMVEWLPADFIGTVRAVNSSSRRVITEEETFRPEVANIIPPQQAGLIARQAGLADSSGWCPVNPATMESTLIPGIYLIGDAVMLERMPKTATAANSQARLCAMAILKALGAGRMTESRFVNLCWSLLGPDEAIRMGGEYRLQNGKLTLSRRLHQEQMDQREKMAAESRDWYMDFSKEVFITAPNS